MSAAVATRPPVPADLAPARASGSLAAARQLAALLVRPTLADRTSWALPVTALGISSALMLTVAGGVRWFVDHGQGPMRGTYVMLAGVALALLAAPLMALAGASARLSATRRDQRLSSLSLVGASAGTIRLLTLFETGAMALAGTLLGLLGHLALMPLVGMLPFMGTHIGPTGIWLGPLWTLAVMAALVLLCLVSSAIGLRRVVVSPLGVRTRTSAPQMGRWRAIVGFGGLAVVLLVAQNATRMGSRMGFGLAVVAAIMIASFGVPLLLVNLLGPWLIAVQARRDARRAKTPVQLMAARATLENPKGLWRQVGGLSVTSFIASFMGVGMAATGQSSNPSDQLIFDDIRTGLALTLAIAFITAACQIGVTQASAISERRQLHVGLAMLGVPVGVVDRARRRSVMRPVLLVVLVSAVPGFLLMMGVASSALTKPLTLAVTPAVLLLGIATIAASLLVTRPTLARSMADAVGGRQAGVGE